MPDFSFESRYEGVVAGVDEAGCGPWAGPVVAAAVILNQDDVPQGLDDSKKLSAKRRDVLFDAIMQTAQVGIGVVSVEEIDRINILQAAKTAMQKAVSSLPSTPTIALIDGNRPVKLHCESHCIVKGDSISLSIAAASIIAKVSRDRLMRELASQHPHYGWDRNAGYGTAEHQNAIANFGITKHHRRSFAPIRRVIEESLDA
jgi:ribonuclease HII